MGLPVVDTDGKVKLAGEVQLADEAMPLEGALFLIFFPVIVEADFADGDDFMMFRPLGQPLFLLFGKGDGVIGMDADTAEDGIFRPG